MKICVYGKIFWKEKVSGKKIIINEFWYNFLINLINWKTPVKYTHFYDVSTHKPLNKINSHSVWCIVFVFTSKFSRVTHILKTILAMKMNSYNPKLTSYSRYKHSKNKLLSTKPWCNFARDYKHWKCKYFYIIFSITNTIFLFDIQLGRSLFFCFNFYIIAIYFFDKIKWTINE